MIGARDWFDKQTGMTPYPIEHRMISESIEQV